MIMDKPYIRTALEFGSGYSTYVIAKALQENKNRFYAHNKGKEKSINYKVAHRYGFKLYTIEQDREWLLKVQASQPKELNDIIKYEFSDCYTSTFNGQLCSYYSRLPNIIPDFIYLDAPETFLTNGNVNGLSFNNCLSNPERDAMSPDVLLI